MVTASIGISAYPQDGSDATLLLQAADAAMYRAKRAGRNRNAVYLAKLAHLDHAAVERLQTAPRSSGCH